MLNRKKINMPDCYSDPEDQKDFTQPLGHVFDSSLNPMTPEDQSDKLDVGKIIRWRNPETPGRACFYRIVNIDRNKHTVNPVVELEAFSMADDQGDYEPENVIRMPLDMLKELLRRKNIGVVSSLLTPANLCSPN